MMEYKGYIAETEYDDILGGYAGSVINSGSYSIVSFESETEEDLYRIFQEAIDDYLAWCAEDGVDPARPSSLTT